MRRCALDVDVFWGDALIASEHVRKPGPLAACGGALRSLAHDCARVQWSHGSLHTVRFGQRRTLRAGDLIVQLHVVEARDGVPRVLKTSVLQVALAFFIALLFGFESRDADFAVSHGYTSAQRARAWIVDEPLPPLRAQARKVPPVAPKRMYVLAKLDAPGASLDPWVGDPVGVRMVLQPPCRGRSRMKRGETLRTHLCLVLPS